VRQVGDSLRGAYCGAAAVSGCELGCTGNVGRTVSVRLEGTGDGGELFCGTGSGDRGTTRSDALGREVVMGLRGEIGET
jgi:hypothetical protein